MSEILTETDTEDARAADRRAQILDAAEALFLRYGFKRTSMDDVARETGIAKGTVYLSFSSKEEVFNAMVDRITTRFLRAARAAAEGGDGLEVKVLALIEYLVRAPGELLYASEHVDELLASKKLHAGAILERFDTESVALVNAVLRAGGISVQEAGEMVLAAGHGVKKLKGAAKPGFDALARPMVGALLEGLLTQRRARR